MSARSERLLALWTGLCLVVAAIAGGLALTMWRDLQAGLAEGRALAERAAGCAAGLSIAPAPSPSEPPTPAPAPPQDPVRRAGSYLGDAGVDVSALMRATITRLQGTELRSQRIGDPRLLRPGQIHVVNLWASWCSACKEEMPDLRDLFARRGDWEDVHFVALQVDDHSDPVDAYAAWREVMPAGALRLADRGQGGAVLAALGPADGHEALYYGALPTTLVLDCNRRVRWAMFERLDEGDLRDLESRLDALRAELSLPRCQQAWCGNGRCDPGEPGRCPLDCGEVGADPQAPASDPPLILDDPATPTCPGPACPSSPSSPSSPEARPCPSRCLRCTSEGRCIPRLQGAPPELELPAAPSAPASCGDGRCDAADGETSATCCQDCGCHPSYICLADTAGVHACRPRLKP